MKALSAFVGLALAGVVQAQTFEVASPDGTLVMEVSIADGAPHYRLLHGGEEVIGTSHLGFVAEYVNQEEPTRTQVADFTRTVTLKGRREVREVTDRYTMVTGKQRENSYVANAAEFLLTDDETETSMALLVHAADDGVAFRYVLLGDSPLFHTVTGEATEFNIGLGGTHWGQPYDTATVWQPAYETPWNRGLPIGSGPGDDVDNEWEEAKPYPGWSFPLLFRDEAERWVFIGETNLTRDYHGSHIAPDAAGGVYKVKAPIAESGLGIGRNVAGATLPMEMPWRFILVSEDVGDIVESNRVHDLAGPSEIADTTWIRPGKVSWSWWSDHASSRSETAMLPFIDYAAEMGWPYSLIDANWNTISDTAMEDLVAYADGKGVKLLFWYNSGGRHNAVTEAPRNIMDTREARRADMAKMQSLGVAGIKVDFFHSDKQDRIAQYLDILEDAAEFGLLVNFHGSTIPRGWQRTWPNLMTMESVRGSEAYTFKSFPNYAELAVWQNTVIPFTRNVIGSMDYTPVNFSDEYTPHITTYAHEAALGVLFESGLQHLSDSVESYRAMSADYARYLRGLPVVWDEVRHLWGTPGEHVVLARRDGERWYVAGVNGTEAPLKVRVEVPEIAGQGGTLLYDGDEVMDFTSARIREPGGFEVTMAPRGGFVWYPD